MYVEPCVKSASETFTEFAVNARKFDAACREKFERKRLMRRVMSSGATFRAMSSGWHNTWWRDVISDVSRDVSRATVHVDSWHVICRHCVTESRIFRWTCKKRSDKISQSCHMTSAALTKIIKLNEVKSPGRKYLPIYNTKTKMSYLVCNINFNDFCNFNEIWIWHIS